MIPSRCSHNRVAENLSPEVWALRPEFMRHFATEGAWIIKTNMGDCRIDLLFSRNNVPQEEIDRLNHEIRHYNANRDAAAKWYEMTVHNEKIRDVSLEGLLMTWQQNVDQDERNKICIIS